MKFLDQKEGEAGKDYNKILSLIMFNYLNKLKERIYLKAFLNRNSDYMIKYILFHIINSFKNYQI